MKLIQVVIVLLMLFAATKLAAGQEKELICHVGNKESRSGETYLDDPDCKGGNCPDAGKIDLILVANPAQHLGNPAHMYDGISDYRPEDVGASGDDTEDSNGDGIDDGCEPQVTCPCWDVIELMSVTAENQAGGSCDTGSNNYPESAAIQNDGSMPSVEGGFAAVLIAQFCFTREAELDLAITAEEAAACIDQIAARCEAIGSPITD